MATEQDQALINQLAGQQLGDANATAGAPQEAPQQAQAQQEPPKPQDAPPTDNEKAQALAATKKEGDETLEESVTMFEVAFNGEQRKLPDETDMAQFLQAATQAYIKNPQMGGQRDNTPDQQGQSVTSQRNLDSEIENQIKRWEEENAVELPPMYRDGFRQIQMMQQENAQLREMMNQFLASAQGINQDAAQAAVSAEQQANQAYRQQAANNLNMAQQKYQLPDSDEEDFFNFAFERGFTVEDFIDRDLTEKVMGDFVAVKQKPEMDRLRSIAQRRQAYTGAMASTPGASGEVSQPNADQEFMNSVAEQAMRKRNMI